MGIHYVYVGIVTQTFIEFTLCNQPENNYF